MKVDSLSALGERRCLRPRRSTGGSLLVVVDEVWTVGSSLWMGT